MEKKIVPQRPNFKVTFVQAGSRTASQVYSFLKAKVAIRAMVASARNNEDGALDFRVIKPQIVIFYCSQATSIRIEGDEMSLLYNELCQLLRSYPDDPACWVGEMDRLKVMSEVMALAPAVVHYAA